MEDRRRAAPRRGGSHARARPNLDQARGGRRARSRERAAPAGRAARRIRHARGARIGFRRRRGARARSFGRRDGDQVSGRLEGKVAAISGSSRGIGLAVARAFLAEGAKVAINSRDPAVADRVAEELGAGAAGVGADVSTEAGAKALVGGTIEAFGRLDVLINNAGMSAALPTLELGLDRWQKVVDLNMTSVFLCSREAARHML
ncbi:MAG: SDR family NAD(P)-dependent oxidoreductase, partial [Chloroflexi bacterium]